MPKVTVIPIVFGPSGAISKRFEKFVKEVGIHIRVEHVQKTVRYYYDITILRFNITIGS